ncbi:hypothetical protein F5Y02DRAFT_144164 [Annulohypoxylon stygium]|nr:hypothetical protein F5Y02DRAFT_144164 [Annulohypoxylon stygium]
MPRFIRRFRERLHTKGSETSFEVLSTSASSASAQIPPKPARPTLTSNLPEQQTNHVQKEHEQNEHDILSLQESPIVPETARPAREAVMDESRGHGLDVTSTSQDTSIETEISRESLWDRAYKSLDEDMIAKHELLVDTIVKEEDGTIPNEQDTEVTYKPKLTNPRILVDEVTRRGQDELAKRRHDQVIGLSPRDVLDKFAGLTSFVKPLVD